MLVTWRADNVCGCLWWMRIQAGAEFREFPIENTMNTGDFFEKKSSSKLSCGKMFDHQTIEEEVLQQMTC